MVSLVTSDQRGRLQAIPKVEVFPRYPVAVEIAESARPHGIADDDIAHAIRQPIRWIEQADRRALIIGADGAGRLLEVVVLDPGNEPLVVHVQVLRPAFYDQL